MNYLRLIFIFLCIGFSFSQEKQPKTNTQIADSLDFIGEYKNSLIYRDLALKEKGHGQNYIKFLKAKWHYTTSCKLETIGGQDNHRKALEHSTEALKLCEEINPKSNIFFIQQIRSRIYHQHGYLGQWKQALDVANKDLQILLDTFPIYDKKVLYVMDDLGYINTLIGDPQKANEYYGETYELYKKHHPENLKDVYINYNRMADNYKNLGLRKEEYRVLSEVENYWTNVSNDEERFSPKFFTYKKLADWHNFYGNYELTENYLQKQEKLFDSVSKSHKKTEQKELDRKDLLELYANYIKLYYNTYEIEKVKEYIAMSRDLLKESKRYYKWDIDSEINLLFLESQLPEKTLEESARLLEQAINLASKFSSTHFTNPLPYQIELFNLYKKHQKFEQALIILEKILTDQDLEDNIRFKLHCDMGEIFSYNSMDSLAEKEFTMAMQFIVKESNGFKNFNSISVNDLKEFYSYDTLEGLLFIGNFFLNKSARTKSEEEYQKALNIFLVSSEMFERIYTGDKYNEKLFKFYKVIESGLTSCMVINNTSEVIDSCTQALVNNASKLSWSKFILNRSINKINVPDSILNRDLKLKTLINYYQSKIYETKKDTGVPMDSMMFRLVDLNNQLRQNQEYIRKNYSHYFNRSESRFIIQKFKDRLKNNQAIVKISAIENTVVLIVITQEQSSFLQIENIGNLKEALLSDVRSLSTYNSKIQLSDQVKRIGKVISELKSDRITIIPEGIFNLIPFEMLIDDYLNSDKVISYSSSLSLFSEQLKIRRNQNPLKVALFTGQDPFSETTNYLPSVELETKNIAQICQSETFLAAKKIDFLQKASEFSVLHLAMHSTIDDENPELSSLNFFDKELLVGELYNESIDAELAVLSACDTGFGTLQNGEGIQSISKAFTYAGVPSTVMSLWKVDDKATAILMTSFYKYLEQGKPKDVALKLAKKEYLNSDLDPELKHPYYWSAFVISGNVEPFDVNTINHYWWLTLLVLPFGGFYFYKKSKLGK